MEPQLARGGTPVSARPQCEPQLFCDQVRREGQKLSLTELRCVLCSASSEEDSNN